MKKSAPAARLAGRPSGGLKVLALTNQFPSPLEPRLAPFNGCQLQALSQVCQLSLVSPLPFFRALKGNPQGQPLPEPGFPVRRPWFWYVPGLLRSWQGRFYLASCWAAIAKAARELEPDLLYATWLYPDAWAGMAAARRLGLPLAVKVHGSDLNLFALDPARQPALTQVLAAAGAVIAPSRALADQAGRMGVQADRLFVAPNGVDHGVFFPADRELARRELGLDPAQRWLLFVGELHQVKGPEVALRALARLPQARMLIVGKGELRPRLERLAQELGLGERVRWAGQQTSAGVARHMAACDALVLASLAEGEPNVVIEALAAGRPVAASAVGGVPALLREGQQGALAQPGDPASLAAALERVLERDWDPAALAASVASRSWPASAARLLEALEAARQGGPA